jgi:tRNA (guanine37-N1)-methyltransferase
MKIDILTLFPEMFTGPFDYSIVKRARENKTVEINVHNLRDWATDKYKSVDDHPYGGGAGMVMRVDIIDRAIESLRSPNTKVILLDAAGEKYSQKKAIQLSKERHLVFICGHYEGVDHRVHEKIADQVISVGDYVLSGGEIPTMTIIDSITRLLPGVLGNADSLAEESHNVEGTTEYPQYTRPFEYKGWKIPEVLLTGNHKKISEWRESK